MTDLKCSVVNCGYNSEKCCCKGDIMVGGKHAGCEEDTCCESFVDQDKERVTSALCHKSHNISIDCEAEKCMYNENYRCSADHVDVKGNGAKSSEGTVCGTFKERH